MFRRQPGTTDHWGFTLPSEGSPAAEPMEFSEAGAPRHHPGAAGIGSSVVLCIPGSNSQGLTAVEAGKPPAEIRGEVCVDNLNFQVLNQV